MHPIEFPQQSVVFAKDQPEYLPLPAYRTPDGQEVTACWGMTWRERIRVPLPAARIATARAMGDRARVTFDRDAGSACD